VQCLDGDVCKFGEVANLDHEFTFIPDGRQCA
jgi:hypothetical protein